MKTLRAGVAIVAEALGEAPSLLQRTEYITCRSVIHPRSRIYIGGSVGVVGE